MENVVIGKIKRSRAVGKIKGSFKSKTMYLGLVVDILAVVQISSGFLSAQLTPAQLGWLLLVIGIVIKVCRWITSRSLDDMVKPHLPIEPGEPRDDPDAV